MGYLYVLGTDNGLVKIGVTERHVVDRIRNLQTGCPFKITKTWASENITGFRQCERIMHACYADKQTNGEWFAIDFPQAVTLAERVCAEHGEDPLMKYINDLYDRLLKVEDELRVLKYGRYKVPK